MPDDEAPTAAQGYVVDHVVISNDIAVDRGDAARAKGIRPGTKDGRRVDVFVPATVGRVASAQRGIGGAADDQAAAQDAVDDVSVGVKAGPVAIVGAKLIEGSRSGEELRVGGRNEVLPGISFVQHVPRDQIDH